MANHPSSFVSEQCPPSPPPPYSVMARQSNEFNRQHRRRDSSNDRSWPLAASNVPAITVFSTNRPSPLNVSGPVDLCCNTHPSANMVTHSMNWEVTPYDRAASRLCDALCRFDGDDSQAQADLDELTKGLTLDDDDTCDDVRGPRSTGASRAYKASGQGSGGIISFKKTWMYANSRLPPQVMPLKLYVSTWSILSRAADAAMAVYSRPRSNERQEYIDADWRHGTKAMALKSVCLDEKNLIVFAIRGSKWNLFDWAVNFRPAPTEPIGFLDDTGNACHAGFLHVAKAMVPRVAARLRQLLEQDPARAASSLVLTGHSAGAAVASLLYTHMMSKLVESELNVLTDCFRRVHCVTFGAPPVSLLPLQRPHGRRNNKNIFIAFANEGDPVVRADKQYVASLCRLIASPAPAASRPPPRGLRAKVSRQKLRRDAEQSSSAAAQQAPWWPVPDATLSNAGRIVLLRKRPSPDQSTEAVCVSDEELRNVIFGDPSMHDMALYRQRIEDLAIAAVTGRDGGQ